MVITLQLVYAFVIVQALLRGGGGLLEGGLNWGGLIYFLRKLCDNFPPTQRNVWKTTMYSNNFNTTLNLFRCSSINFSTIQLYICFKMFMTWVWCVMLFLQKWEKISWNLCHLKLHIFVLIGGGGLIEWGGGGLNKYLHLKRGVIREGAYLWGGGLNYRHLLRPVHTSNLKLWFSCFGIFDLGKSQKILFCKV